MGFNEFLKNWPINYSQKRNFILDIEFFKNSQKAIFGDRRVALDLTCISTYFIILIF